ncbi:MULTISPECIES: FecR domain-containing protein [unclassified Sinorhizobium]|uniref:FecR family protein n=1 Tax=unclassified Sinorhizobium TaxID=2613772 RepID=UPI00352330C0
MDDDFEALKREATAWIVRITSGTATREDADALVKWRSQSEAHERAFQDAARLWKNLAPALGNRGKSPGALLTRRAFLATGSLAAGAAGISFGLSELGFLPTLDALLSDYATAVGEQRTVQLPDGSTAMLDGGTALSLDFTPQARNLHLTTGAAVFDVVTDDRKPFVVTAGDGNSTAASGSFSVTHGVDSVWADCLNGNIRVQCLGTTDLVEGESISYSSRGLGEKITSDIETAAAWRKGLLIFKNRPLGDVVSDLNRHRRGKVMIARRDLRSRRVSGVFHLSRPEEILAHLEDTLQVRPINLVGGVVLLQ